MRASSKSRTHRLSDYYIDLMHSTHDERVTMLRSQGTSIVIKDESQRAADFEPDKEHGRKGKNGNWPGCTAEFVKRVEKDRAKAKAARKARKKARK